MILAKVTPLDNVRCTRETGLAHNVELKLLNYLLSQMEAGQFSAVIVTDKCDKIGHQDVSKLGKINFSLG